MAASCITMRGVNQFYGTRQVLTEISLEIGKGCIYGILGPSGCGKTTLVKAMAGILVPTTGTQVMPQLAVMQQIGYMAQSDALYTNLSGTVISVNYTDGAMVSAGSDLVELTDASRMYLLTYLPIEQAATVSYGQPVTVQLDKQTYQGEVCFIDVKAQYTPAEFQTAFQRDQESMKVKIKLPADTQLKPG